MNLDMSLLKLRVACHASFQGRFILSSNLIKGLCPTGLQSLSHGSGIKWFTKARPGSDSFIRLASKRAITISFTKCRM